MAATRPQRTFGLEWNEMRKLMLAAIGLAALVSACGMAQAEGDQAANAPAGGHGRGGFLMRADANNDGVVTRQEFDTSRVAEFVRLDVNRDGQLSRDEMRAGRHWGGHGRGGPDGGGPGGPGGHRFDLARLDTNHDGAISHQEFNARPDGMFDRLDTNHDGVISAQEQQAAQQAMQQRIAERRANRPDPDTNGDGSISRAEWDAMGAAMFQRMDANNDRRVTREEAEAARPRRGE
jgi:Ca2+-binding EF-hand superfamily protein